MSTAPIPAHAPLKEAFAARDAWHANRSSAIFPVRMRPGTDLWLAYLNYWVLKNHLSVVQRTVRLYDTEGRLAGRLSARVEGNWERLSVREMFRLQDGFDGMVEIELISVDNLRFGFPALQGFYTAGQRVSSVHSAGRVRNPDEAQVRGMVSTETNWICKFGQDVVPFFHLFCGNAPLECDAVRVALYSPAHDLLASCELRGEQMPTRAFASRLCRLDELFPAVRDTPPPEGSFCRVTIPAQSIFPRLVVGNLFLDQDFLEVTHSFSDQTVSDYVVPPPDVELASFIAAPCPADLALTMWSFPTNCPGEILASLRVQDRGEQGLRPSPGSELSWRTGGAGSALWRYSPSDRCAMASIDLRGARVPSRLNVSYQFKVAGVDTAFGTDVATGAKSCVYPPKHTHWSSSVIGGGFRTVLIVRNMSHRPSATRPARGSLSLWFDDGREETRVIEVQAEAAAFVTITGDGATPELMHWQANFDVPSVEMFWVSHATDGRICGDHSF